jgi:hypothetical protein
VYIEDASDPHEKRALGLENMRWEQLLPHIAIKVIAKISDWVTIIDEFHSLV